jgi:hypothetical protein
MGADQNDKFKLQVAYHEAGHAVSAALLGIKVVRVCIGPGRHGRTVRENPLYEFEGQTTDQIPQDRFNSIIFTGAVVIVAGEEAQRIHDRNSIKDWQIRDDAEDLHGLMRNVDVQQRRPLERSVRRQCKALLKDNWAAVDRVARALLEKIELTGDEVAALI